MYSDEIKDQFAELRAAGHSLRAISQKLNVPRSTLSDWNDDFATYIHGEHRIALQDQLETLAVSKTDRIEALAVCFKKLEMRLRKSKDPLKDARLYDLLLKYDQYMNSELLHEGNPITAEEAKENKPPITFVSAIPPLPEESCTCNTGPVEKCHFHGDAARERKRKRNEELAQKRRELQNLEREIQLATITNDDDPDPDDDENTDDEF